MVVDHHRINLQTNDPLYYVAEPVGCTSTIIYKLYKQNDVEITPKMAGIMLSAIISDTLLFKSPTCTEEDKKIAQKLADIAGVDMYEYGQNMLKAGTDISDYTADEVINIDCKPLGREMELTLKFHKLIVQTLMMFSKEKLILKKLLTKILKKTI